MVGLCVSVMGLEVDLSRHDWAVDGWWGVMWLWMGVVWLLVSGGVVRTTKIINITQNPKKYINGVVKYTSFRPETSHKHCLRH